MADGFFSVVVAVVVFLFDTRMAKAENGPNARFVAIKRER